MCQPCPRTCVHYVPGLYTETKGVDRQGETGLRSTANAVGAIRFKTFSIFSPSTCVLADVTSSWASLANGSSVCRATGCAVRPPASSAILGS